MERLERMAAELKAWAESDQFMCLVEDEFYRILEVDSDIEEFLGVKIASLPSLSMAQVSSDIQGRLGMPSMRGEEKTPKKADVFVFYYPKGSLVSVRAISLISPLNDRTIGNIRLVVAQTYTEEELRTETERAVATLKGISPSGEVLAVISNSTDGNVYWHGSEPSWQGINRDDVHGKRQKDFEVLLSQRLGQSSSQLVDRESTWDEFQVLFVTPAGKREGRCFVLPYYEDGDHVGSLRLIALKD